MAIRPDYGETQIKSIEQLKPGMYLRRRYSNQMEGNLCKVNFFSYNNFLDVTCFKKNMFSKGFSQYHDRYKLSDCGLIPDINGDWSSNWMSQARTDELVGIVALSKKSSGKEKVNKKTDFSHIDRIILEFKNSPEKADDFEWESLTGEEMSRVFIAMPHLCIFADWTKFSGNDWARLARKQPGFFHYCDNKEALSGDDWFLLVLSQPQFSILCDWWKLNNEQKKILCEKHPFMTKEIYG